MRSPPPPRRTLTCPSPGLKHILAPLPRKPSSERHRGLTCGERLFGLLRLAPSPDSSCALSQSHVSPVFPLEPPRCPKRRRTVAHFSRDPVAPPIRRLSSAHRVILYKLASVCRARCTPAPAVFPLGTVPGTLWGTNNLLCSRCTNTELPTRSKDSPVGSWGVVISVGGAILVSLLSNHYAYSPHRN